MYKKGGSGNTSNWRAGLDRAFVRFELRKLSGEFGMTIPMPYVVSGSQGNNVGCPVCGHEFRSGRTYDYAEHWKTEHPRYLEALRVKVRAAQLKRNERRAIAEGACPA